MVLTKRGIKPTQDYVQQNQIQGTKNIVLLSSEQYTNVGLIEQLTSFFEYSSSIFSELLTDIEKSSRRIQELGQRVHHASLTIPSVEQTFELANNGDNFITTSRIDFQSELGEQSYLFPKETNIPALTKVYEGCFLPPPLQQLDPYREDNMSCAKLYSNPGFFIESWIMAQREKIAKDKLKREERRQKRAERRKEKQINTNTEKVNAKSVNLRRDKFKNMEDSPTTSNETNYNQTPQNNVSTFTPLQPPPTNNTSSFGPPPSFGNTPPPPNFGNTPPPPNFGNTPPPPNFGNTPPPPNFGNTPPPPPNFGNTPPPPNFGNTPPPPPNFGNTPPPPPNFGNTPPPPNFGNTNTPPPPPPTGGFNNVPQIDNSPPPPPPPTGGLGGELHKIESSNTSGGGLLDAIKKGVNLKKSEKPVEKEIIPESNTGFNTNLIAMVLNQRREALEDSDDDDDSDASWD